MNCCFPDRLILQSTFEKCKKRKIRIARKEHASIVLACYQLHKNNLITISEKTCAKLLIYEIKSSFKIEVMIKTLFQHFQVSKL